MMPIKMDHHHFSPELIAYFEAINQHMKARLGSFNSANSTQSAHDLFLNQNSDEFSNKIKCQVNQFIEDNAECEVRLVSEMLTHISALESALLEVSDKKKVKFNEDLEASFNQMWCGDVAVVMSALEFVKHILKDTHRYAQYLEGEVDRLVLACSRVLTAIYPNYHDNFSNEHQNSDSELQNQFLEPIDSIAQIISSLFKCPVLSTAISPESFSALFTSLMPYYLNFSKFHKNVKSQMDHKLQFKIEPIIFNLIGTSDSTAFLLILLRILKTKLNIYNQDFTVLPELEILTEWLESFGYQLNRVQISKMKLNLIFLDIETLMQDYPESQLETKREYRLLVALHEIVYKIVKFKGDPAIWEHLTISKGVEKHGGTANSNLLKLINVIFENQKTLAPKFVDSNEHRIHILEKRPERFLFKWAEIQNESVIDELTELNSDFCDPIEELQFPDFAGTETGLATLFFGFNILATTSDMNQAKFSLDYFNQKFDVLAQKYPEKLEPVMDLLVRVCIRQFRLFVIRYFKPTTYVTQPSDESLQIFQATTSLLKRIFTSSIYLKSLRTQTLFDLLMIAFSFGLAWSTNFASEAIKDLEFTLISSDLFDRSGLICVCIRMLATDLCRLKSYSVSMYEQYWKWTRDVLYELVMPLQFASKEEIGKLNLDSILQEIVNFMNVQSMSHKILMTKIDKFLYYTDATDRVGDKRPLTILLQLTLDIIANKPESINAHLKKPVHSTAIQLYNQFIMHSMIQKKTPDLSPFEIGQIILNDSNEFPKAFLGLDFVPSECKLEESNDLAQKLENFKISLSYSEYGAVGSAAPFVNSWYRQLDDYIKYPEFYAQFVDTITFKCAKLMNQIEIGYSCKNVKDILGSPKVPELADALGKLLLKLFHHKEYSSGHEHITDSTFDALLKANISLIFSYPYALENLAPEIQWIWDIKSSLTNYSKPELLLPLAIEILLSDLNIQIYENGMERPTVELAQMRQAELCIEMIQISCEKLFFSVGSTYSSELMSSNAEKFQLESLLKNVDELMCRYSSIRLEQERDYRLWELMKRILERLFQHHGSDIERHLGKIIDNRDNSPVIAYFRQLSN